MKLKFELNENKNGLVVASGEDTKGKVAIPSEHEYEGNMYPVKEIGSFAFDRCEYLESIEVPSSVTKIGRCAFYGCTSLESVVIPDSVTEIDNFAFEGCYSLKSIVIPDSVRKIGDRAFDMRCWLSKSYKLESIYINDASLLADAWVPAGVKVVNPESHSFVFLSNEKLTTNKSKKLYYKLNATKDGLVVTGGEDIEGELVIPSEMEYEGKLYPVTEIGYKAFLDCTNMTNVVIPNTVTEIGGDAFYGCEGLTSIVIPASVTAIGGEAFDGCMSLNSIKVADNNQVYDSRDNCNAIIETATNCLIKGCATTVIPDSVTEIGTFAFYCTGLTSIVIPDSVTKIGFGAFEGCTNMRNIVIPNTVTEIAMWTFKNCTSLTSIVIPGSVTVIGEDAFIGCDGLEEIVINDASLLENAGVPEGVKIVKP